MFSKNTNHPDVDFEIPESQDPSELIFSESKYFSSIFPFNSSNDLGSISEEISDLNSLIKTQSDAFNNLTIIQKAATLVTKNLKLHQIVQKTLQFCNEIIPFYYGNIIISKDDKWKAVQRNTKKIFESCFKTLSKDGLIDWMFNKQTYVVVPVNELKFHDNLLKSGNILCFPMQLESGRIGVCIFYLNNEQLSFSLADLEAVKIIANQAASSIKFNEVHKQLIQSEEKDRNVKELLSHFVKMAIVGELAKGIAHEINNPLQVILGKIQMAMVGMNNKDVLKSVEKQALQIALLVRLISSVSKGQKRDCADIIEVNSFIRSTISLIQNQIEKKGIKINFYFDNKEIKIFGNSGYLEQLILNSVINAKKRMSQGGELYISAGLIENNLIRIQFKDTAPQLESVAESNILKDISKLKKVGDFDLLFGEIINTILVEEMGGKMQYSMNDPSGNNIIFRIPQKI